MGTMLVNPTTMLVEDFGDIDKKQLYQDIKLLTTEGTITDLIRKVSEEWRVGCELDERQWLLVLSTVFPQKVLISLIEDYQFSYLI